jgi:hypothetical protein
MACELEQIQTDACTSGIGKVTDRIALLQIIAQLTCEASEGGGGSGVPSGVILMWSGTIASIPSGWVLCNGSNGTPDLRNRFVVAAQQDDAGQAKTNLTGALTVSGGSVSHTHGITDPQHQHAYTNSLGSGNEILDSSPGGNWIAEVTGSVDPAPTGITVNSQSAPQPYYALAFIMKS